MGQKVHPIGIRLGIVKDWLSKWYARSSDFHKTVWSDYQIRVFLMKTLAQASVSRIVIERPAKNALIRIFTSRPGVIIGKKGTDIDTLREKVSKLAGIPVHITIEEVRKPDLDARLLSESISQQLEKRVPYRRAMKRAVASAMRAGAKGIKVCISGRLAGAEIARTEWYREGRVPLHTFRSDIDFAITEAKTTYGIIGVKVWVYKGDIINKAKDANESEDSKKQV